MQFIDSAAAHLFVTGPGKGHLKVVEPGRSDGVEPVDHLLQRPARTQRQSHSRPAGTHAVTLHLFTLCAVGSREERQVALFYTI